jgi:hypothetical protein
MTEGYFLDQLLEVEERMLIGSHLLPVQGSNSGIYYSDNDLIFFFLRKKGNFFIVSRNKVESILYHCVKENS